MMKHVVNSLRRISSVKEPALDIADVRIEQTDDSDPIALLFDTMPGWREGLFNLVDDGVIVIDADDRIVWQNAKAVELLNLEQTGLGGALLEPRTQAGYLDGKAEPQIQLSRFVWVDGQFVQTRQETGHLHEPSVFILVDKRDSAKLRRHAWHHANHDPLTGLANRPALNAHLPQAIADADRNQAGLAALIIDIDRFRLINDTYGDQEGDRVLSTFASRLAAHCKDGDLAARFGNDTFVILAEQREGRRDAGLLAEKLLADINRPVDMCGDFISANASVGVSVWPDDAETGPELIRNAELALRKIKLRGNDFLFFSDGLEQAAKQEREIRQQLRAALAAGDFSLYFQPLITLDTGSVKGFEALIRWNRIGRDPIPPSVFIPIAESAGLIESMTDWVARTAIDHSQQWKNAGFGDLGMSINVSARHFVHANIAEDLARVLSDQVGRKVNLTVEVTEGMLMSEPRRAVAILERLKSMGIKIAIDDFGTGYSSLAYLKDFPIDSLKIDRTFISQIGADHRQNEIVTAIANLAKNLGLEVVAEGVETQAQASFLASLGCQDAQGYFYSRPVPADRVPSLLGGLNGGRQAQFALN